MTEYYDSTMRQLFSRKGSFSIEHKDPKYVELIWGWDGNREAPTLAPSFLMDRGAMGKLHLHIRDGKLDILADTTFDCRGVEQWKQQLR